MMLQIENLTVFYGKAMSLEKVSLGVESGQIAAIIGSVGAGKSTLLDAVLGLNSSTGNIIFEGQNLRRFSTGNIVRMGVGYAPERGNLFTQMNVRENLLVGAYTSRSNIRRNLDLVFDLFPVLAERYSQEVGTQSGGERQMVSLGRALMNSPRLLLVDEPTIGLSPKVCLDIASVLTRLNLEHGLTIIIAEQNANFTLSLAERIYLLEAGRIIRSGSRIELQRDRAIQESYFGGQR